MTETETDTSEKLPIEVADGSYDCRCPDDSQWRHGIYLKPERRTVRHWSTYWTGCPADVWHGTAAIVDLPRNAVGEYVEAIVRGEKFLALVEELFSLYRGEYWDGSDYRGLWSGDRDGLIERMEALFEDVPTYGTASAWLATCWDQETADGIRDRLQSGETMDSVVHSLSEEAYQHQTWLDDDDLRETVEGLLERFGPEDDDDE